MADVRITDVQYAATQAENAPFDVTVVVNNLETVAPLWPSPALCSKGMLSPDGHNIRVTLTIRDSMGTDVYSKTKDDCAPVQAPSQALGGNAHVNFQATVPNAGDYTIDAHVTVPHAGGEDYSQSHQLTVQANNAGLPDGGADHGNDSGGSGGDWTPPTDWLPDAPSSSDPLGLNGAMGNAEMLLVLIVVAVVVVSRSMNGGTRT